MPQLERVDQLPLPNLNLYVGISGVALFYAVVYAFSSAQSDVMWSDVWCSAAIMNMGCCCFFLLAKFVYSMIFGKLHNIELQHMRDKFWNFVFYKFIFVFGVMNVQEIPEMLCWCAWFAVLGTLLLSEQLCKDRFQFLSFSPNTPNSSHAKVILLLSSILLSCAGLFMVCAVVGWQYGFNHFTFLYSEVFILFARTLHSIIKHIIHLWDMHHDGVWENRNTYTYYVELVLEVAVLFVDFMHHVHMLLWANMFLSVASLILLMKLRFLYQEIQRRLKRHHNYIRVSKTLENWFEHVPSQELIMEDETCAICWEKMSRACRLPCGHLFHIVCLRAWLEQDTVCPTCRRSLGEDLAQGREVVNPQDEQNQGEEQRERGRVRRNMQNARNWLLRFNGASIASWLPTFSLELHQEDNMRWISDAAELHRVAQQVNSMFPHVPLQAITLDLADTHSVSLTVDHILNNSIYIPEEGGVVDNDATPFSNAAEATEPPVRQEEHALQSASTITTPPLPHAHPSLEESSQHSNVDTNDNDSQGTEDPQQSHDSAPQKSHDFDAQDTTSHLLNSSLHHQSLPESPQGESEVRQRKAAVQMVKGGPCDSKNVTKTDSKASGFLSTKESYSRLFSSLQERKAELLRKAKRNYLMKENA